MSANVIHVMELKENRHPNIAVSYPAYMKRRKPRIGFPQYAFSITTNTANTNNNNNASKRNTTAPNNNNNNAPKRNTTTAPKRTTTAPKRTTTTANARNVTTASATSQNRKATSLNKNNNNNNITNTRMHTLYGPLDWRECTNNNSCPCPPWQSSGQSSQPHSPQQKEILILNKERSHRVPQPSTLGSLTLENFLCQAPVYHKFNHKLRGYKKL